MLYQYTKNAPKTKIILRKIMKISLFINLLVQ